MRLRLLPVLAAVAAFTLVVRVGDVLDGAYDMGRGAAAQGAAPKTPPAAAQPVKAEAKPDVKGETKAEAKPGVEGETKAEAKPGVEGETKGEPGLVKGDIAGLTEAEVEVLQGLAQRREELTIRAREIDTREGVVKAAEQRLSERIKELEALRTAVETKLKQQEQIEEGRLKSLIKVYETMKPKDAARILEQLDMAIVVDILGRMKEAKTAFVLSAMESGKAKAVTSELATRKQVLRPKS